MESIKDMEALANKICSHRMKSEEVEKREKANNFGAVEVMSAPHGRLKDAGAVMVKPPRRRKTAVED